MRVGAVSDGWSRSARLVSWLFACEDDDFVGWYGAVESAFEDGGGVDDGLAGGADVAGAVVVVGFEGQAQGGEPEQGRDGGWHVGSAFEGGGDEGGELVAEVAYPGQGCMGEGEVACHVAGGLGKGGDGALVEGWVGLSGESPQ